MRALLGPETALTYRAAESIDPARGSVRLLGVAMDGRGRRVAMEELTLDGLRDDGVVEATARAVPRGTARNNVTVARLRLAGLSVQRPPPGTEFRPDMVRIDALRIEGLRITGKFERHDRRLLGGGLRRGPHRAGFAVRLRPCGCRVQANRVATARAALRGLDLAASLAALVAGEAPPRTQGSYGLEVEGVSVRDRGGRSLGGFGTLRVAGEVPASGPEFGSLALRDLRIEPFPGFAEWLRRFGYEAVTADLSAESRFHRESGRLELTSLSLSGREIGALGLSLVLDGVTPGAAERAEFKAMRLVSAALRYVDQSLYGRYVRQQAREMRVSEQEARNQQIRNGRDDARRARQGARPGRGAAGGGALPARRGARGGDHPAAGGAGGVQRVRDRAAGRGAARALGAGRFGAVTAPHSLRDRCARRSAPVFS